MPYDLNFLLFVPFIQSMDPFLSVPTFNHAFSSTKDYVMLQNFSPYSTVVVSLGILHPGLSSVFCGSCPTQLRLGSYLLLGNVSVSTTPSKLDFYVRPSP